MLGRRQHNIELGLGSMLGFYYLFPSQRGANFTASLIRLLYSRILFRMRLSDDFVSYRLPKKMLICPTRYSLLGHTSPVQPLLPHLEGFLC